MERPPSPRPNSPFLIGKRETYWGENDTLQKKDHDCFMIFIAANQQTYSSHIKDKYFA